MKSLGNILKSRTSHLILSCMMVLMMSLLLGAGHAEAAKTVTYNGKVIAKYNKAGQMVMVTSKDPNVNYKNITYLVSGNKKKTVVIPKGSSIKINGVIRPGNNTTIIATGAKITTKEKSNAVFCAPDKKVKNLTIKGGTWRSPYKDGCTGSMFAFAFADHVIMDGVDCNANYVGHAIEIIACSNVTIKNCVVNAIGKNPANCKEEQIQIDISTPKTAPKVAEYGSKYVQGQTCKNINILNNKVKGARAVGVNWADDGEWGSEFHENIVIKGNTLTGTTSEGLVLFNVIGGKVMNNTVTTKATRTEANASYTIGIHVVLQGIAPASMAKSTLVISGNTVKGNRNGIHVKGFFAEDELICLSQFGTVKVTNNKVYCKAGVENGILQVKDSCKKFIENGNTVKKW